VYLNLASLGFNEFQLLIKKDLLSIWSVQFESLCFLIYTTIIYKKNDDETVELVLAIWKTMNQSRFYFILLYPFDLGLLGCVDCSVGVARRD
jgi:hypothetical protein